MPDHHLEIPSLPNAQTHGDEYRGTTLVTYSKINASLAAGTIYTDERCGRASTSPTATW